MIVFILLWAPAVSAQGLVSGKVVFQGEPPPVKRVDVKSDVGTCGTVQEVEMLVLGKGSGVANAVVLLKGIPAEPAPTGGLIDQVDCQFVPHVQVLPVGSTLRITSSDPVLHNAHGLSEDGSTVFNVAVPFPGVEVPVELHEPGIIKLRCDAGHPWMNAYVVITEDAPYALTDADGRFTLENIPAGSYEIEIWHEWLGTHSQEVEIGEGEQSLTITLENGNGHAI